jgi:hypothetical protein
MHVAPALALQQSLDVVHLSPSNAQPMFVDWHTCPPPASAPASPVPGEQYPPQQSVPVAQDWPSLLQGGNDQKPRMARFCSF